MSAEPVLFRLPWSYPGHADRLAWSPLSSRDLLPPIGLRWIGGRDPEASWLAADAVPSPLHPVLRAGRREAYAIGFVDDSDHERLDALCAEALALARAGDRATARKMLRAERGSLAAGFALGQVELLWSTSRARKEFAAVVERVESSVRPGFTGMLPWSQRENRPFLLALRALGWCAARSGGGPFDLAWPLDSLRWLDPSDALDTVEWDRLLACGYWPGDGDFPSPA